MPRGGEIVIPREEYNWLSNINSQENIHTEVALDRVGCVQECVHVIFVCVYIYIHRYRSCQQVMKKGKKEDMNLDRSKERQVEGFELMKLKKKFM